MKKSGFSYIHDISDKEKIMLDKVLDWISMAEDKYTTKFSSFLDERQCSLCKKVLESEKWENYVFWGGYENAQRQMLCVYPLYSNVKTSDFPLKAVEYKYRISDSLTHRDFLGSLMALQVTRDSIGDILGGEGKTCVFVKDTVSGDALSLKKVGRAGVRAEVGFDKSLVRQQEFSEISGTVSSMRLDCVVSLAVRVSREKASLLIKNSSVEVNCSVCENNSKVIEVNDKFSVRGYGKFILKSINGTTKKDRIHITISKYI